MSDPLRALPADRDIVFYEGEALERRIKLVDSAGSPPFSDAEFTTITLTFRVRKSDSSKSAVLLQATTPGSITINDATNNIFTILVDDTDTSLTAFRPGKHRYSIYGTLSGGDPECLIFGDFIVRSTTYATI